MPDISYRRHRFLSVVIQHAVWLYLRVTLSYRDVEDLLAERGLDLSYETVRSRLLKFGPVIARRLRRRRPRPSDRWHLDEMVCSDRRQADVPLACRRLRGRRPRRAGTESPRQPGGVTADAQASQKAWVCAEIAGN